MKVIITGSKSFIGQHLMRQFEKNEVMGFDIKDGKEYDFFAEKFITDISVCDAVVHLAGLTNVRKSLIFEREFMRVNAYGTGYVAGLCMRYGKKLVFPSTAAVYLGEKPPYAKSKEMAEKLLELARDYIPVTVLRLCNVYGAGMNADSGSVIYELINGAKKGEIEVYGTGENTRDFIGVEDVVKIIREAAVSDKSDGVFDVGTGRAVSILSLAQILAKETGAKITRNTDKKSVNWPIAETESIKKFYNKPLLSSVEEDIKKLLWASRD